MLAARHALVALLVGGCSRSLLARPQVDCTNVSQASVADLYAQRIAVAVVTDQCAKCHVAGGAAGDTRFILVPGDDTKNLAVVAALASVQDAGQPILLAKPTGAVAHGGGVRLQASSQTALDFAELVDTLAGCPAEQTLGAAGALQRDQVQNQIDTSTPDPTTSPNNQGPGGQTPSWQSTYAQHCVECHGAQGEGVGGPTGTSGSLGGPEIHHADASEADYFVRKGDANTWIGCGDPAKPAKSCSTWGDQRTMPAFTTAQVSQADLDAIVAWQASLADASDGAGLYLDHCSRCHGPAGDIPIFTYYVKDDVLLTKPSDTVNHPGLVHYDHTAAPKGFVQHVRDGLIFDTIKGVAIAPEERSRYMPAVPTSAVSDAQLLLIAKYICAENQAHPTMDPNLSPIPGFCSEITPW
jgi:mono/diheme cytochrome c family protein